MNIHTLLEEFCSYQITIRDYKPLTIKRYRQHISFFVRQTGIASIEELNYKVLLTFMMNGRCKRNWSPNTFIAYHKTFIVFFRFLVKLEYIEKNYAKDIELPKLSKRLPKRISKKHALKLMEVSYNYPYNYRFLRYRNKAIFATFLYTGIRKSELLNLKLTDVDLDNMTLFVRQGKGDKDRILPLSFTLIHILREYLSERKRLRKTCPEFFTSMNRNIGFTDNGMKKLLDKMRKATKIFFTWHMLRHTYATLMVEGGCDIFSLSKMMGHSDIKTTTIYLSTTAEHLREQAYKHPLN